jgi:sugar/nucleoside kinase (ribokinase family)
MMADYVLVGHMTADLTPVGRIAGGTVSYAARTAAAFGWKVAVVTSSTADEPLLETLRPFADVRVIPADETTTYENIYGAHGRIQYIRGRAQPIMLDDIPADLRSAQMVHLAPIADEVAPDVTSAFGEATILATLQGWMRRWDADEVVRFKPFEYEHMLRAVDIVVFSEEDIRAAPDTEAWVVQRARHVFVTRAERGGSYFHDGVEDSYTSPQVAVVDPTGAGDIFASALLASLPLVSFDMRYATRIAAHLAAYSVTRRGVLGAPTRDEVARALATGLEGK